MPRHLGSRTPLCPDCRLNPYEDSSKPSLAMGLGDVPPVAGFEAKPRVPAQIYVGTQHLADLNALDLSGKKSER